MGERTLVLGDISIRAFDYCDLMIGRFYRLLPKLITFYTIYSNCVHYNNISRCFKTKIRSLLTFLGISPLLSLEIPVDVNSTQWYSIYCWIVWFNSFV